MKPCRIAIAALLAVASVGMVATTAYADPPPWAPAHGWRAKHHYVYYPSAEVYYAPASRMWFWLGGDGWQAGVSLPLALQGYVSAGGVNIALDVERPYLRNDDVVRRYGGHQRDWWRDRDRGERGDRGNRGDRGDRGERGQHQNGRGHGNGHHGH